MHSFIFEVYTEAFFWGAFTLFLWAPFIVFFCLIVLKIKAPYGRFVSNIWGDVSLPANWGWILMECPSSIIFLGYLIGYVAMGKLTLMQGLFFCVWQYHYTYRSFIYPNIARLSKQMPLSMVFAAFSFQMFNTFFQVRWIFEFAPVSFYPDSYWHHPFFITGLILFLVGSTLNRNSDHILRNLRAPGETAYKIPYGGFFRWVSCPNYLGEMIIWLGWAVMLKHWIGFAFFFWTIANLAPRAFTTHQWYMETFPDYPKNRKALIPFLL